MLTSSCVAKNADVITQQVKDETVLFDMASGNYYALNELGARTWELLDGNRTIAEIAETLALEYDAPIDIIQEDIRALVDKLFQDGLLTEPKG